MELDARDAAALDRGDDGAVVIDRGGRDGLLGHARVAVRKVDVGGLEPCEDPAPVDDLEAVPAHVRNPPRAQSLDPACEQLEPAAALLALAEEKLESDADAEERPACFDALAEGGGETSLLESAGGAARVTDSGDDRERRFADL